MIVSQEVKEKYWSKPKEGEFLVWRVEGEDKELASGPFSTGFGGHANWSKIMPTPNEDGFKNFHHGMFTGCRNTHQLMDWFGIGGLSTLIGKKHFALAMYRITKWHDLKHQVVFHRNNATLVKKLDTWPEALQWMREERRMERI